MRNKLITMLKMQNEMNKIIDPNWIYQQFPWHRAIMAEVGEIYTHDGSWKWWKQQTPNLEQLHLELVDIWHFGLSLLYSKHHLNMEWDGFTENDYHIEVIEGFAEDITTVIHWHTTESELNDPLLVTVEGFTAELLEDKKTFPLQSFIALCLTAGLTFDELYRLYVGKNVLNKFRQANGYKTGEYIKIWNGEEDNVHLMRLMDVMADADSVVGELPDLLYQGLVGMYKTVKTTA